MGLPTLDELVVLPATAEQKHTLGIWGNRAFCPRTDPEVYQRYWREVSDSEMYRDGRYTCWALVRRDDPQGEAYTFVQTCRRDAFIKSGSEQGEITKGWIYAVTFVITPQEYRRHGYSYRTLRTIHHILSGSPPPWPNSWGPSPDSYIPQEVLSTFKAYPATASYLSSAAPFGYYEKCTQGLLKDGGKIGWVSREHENNQIVWTFPASTSTSTSITASSDEWEWEVIPYGKLQSWAKHMSNLERSKLANTPVTKGELVIRVDPSTPGVLDYLRLHILSGMDPIHLSQAKPNELAGIRFFHKRGSPSSPSRDDHGHVVPEVELSDPIILFQAEMFYPAELSITYTHNVTPSLLPLALEIINDLTHGACSRLRIWDCTPDSELGKEIIRLGGEWNDRSREGGWLPFGVAFYGEHEAESSRLDGLQLWVCT